MHGQNLLDELPETPEVTVEQPDHQNVERELIGMMYDLIECHRALLQRVVALEQERRVWP